MEDCERAFALYDILASRKAEEAAWRRFHAAAWLESLVGPLGIPSQPSEKDFISCLRNGLVLCNAINKVHPGAVPKVVEKCSHLQSITREPQPLPAYQYFENVKNFLLAVEELKLPAFEASDLERDNLEAGSVAKVVDCVLALKSYHECKQMSSGNGYHRPIRSPLVMHSASRNNVRPVSSDSCRSLDMSLASEKETKTDVKIQKLQDAIVKILAEHLADAKENIDDSLLSSIRSGNTDPMKLLKRIMSICLEDKLQDKSPEKQVKSVLEDVGRGNCISASDHSTTEPLQISSELRDSKLCGSCLRKDNCNHRSLFQMQERELLDLKALLKTIKREFEHLQCQYQRDLYELGIQVQEMSTAALGYHRVLTENRKLYNTVQDLKGNIRVYCRIRPAFTAETCNVIEFIGADGALVISDPIKNQKDGRKVFQFNKVFGPTATQAEVFNDTQPLIRSVMDGYNVCIFAYGQTGSGKTYTMSGPSGGSTKDMGINYLALNDLFQMSNERRDVIGYDIRVQMVEIYNETVRDLLAEDSTATKLEIRSCVGDDGLTLPDAKMRSVNSTADVLNLMRLGEVNRVVSATALNNRSSRSHSVLTIHVHGKDANGSALRSCLHLVDLAGSERVYKSEVTGDRLKEAQYINKSLSCLGDVITALAQKNSYIPYRNSKLTLLLQDSLGGHAKTLMFAHVSPEADSFGETVSTLKFAQRVSTVELGAARANKESSEIIRLKEEVEYLRKALGSKESQNAQPKSPCERTPPRARRLSIESSSSMKAMKTPSIASASARSRRLSLEGPRYGKLDTVETRADEESKPLPFESLTLQNHGQSQDLEAVSKQYGLSNKGSSTTEAYRFHAPQSPTSSSYQMRMMKADRRTHIPSLQAKTPEPLTVPTTDVQMVMQTQVMVSTDSQTANGKGSQIRRSLRSIGKLINGTEKRAQMKPKEALSPIRGTSNVNDHLKSPPAATARTLRRQSLTSVQTSGFKSRRTSLEGKVATDTDNSRRNARTPPPVHSSTRTTKRWV